jgi:cytochrome P450 family 135
MSSPPPLPPPPGPRLPRLVQTALFLRDPLRVLETSMRRHGPVFRLRFSGFPTEVFVANAELAELVYAVDDGGGRAGEVRRQVLEPVVGRHSLLSLDGPEWKRHRKLLGPPLHGRAISGYREEIAAIAAGNIAGWPIGRPFPLRDRMQEITLEVILRLVFGIRDTERLTRLRALIPQLIEIGSSPVLLMMPPRLRAWVERSRLLRRVPFLPTTRFVNVRNAVDEILYDEITRRRTAIARAAAASARDSAATDVLSRLLAARDDDGRAMDDQEIRDELITLLEAGHETTATGLAWAFERLLRTPPVLARLRAEIDAGQDETYLEAVVKETLRLRPVVYDAPRLLDAPLRLGDFEAPAGWFAAPLICLIHRDPAAYPDPAAFRPERFLGADAAVATRSWMPFGGGRRYCVGAQLALLEMRVIIREVLRRVDLTPADPASERPRMKHVTFVPARGTRVLVRQRRNVPNATAAAETRPTATGP